MNKATDVILVTGATGQQGGGTQATVNPGHGRVDDRRQPDAPEGPAS